MAKFKPVVQNFLLNTLIGFEENMVRNYNGDVQDDDFFDIIQNGFDHDQAVELIETAYSEKEIEDMRSCRNRRNRLDFEDNLSCIFQALWNNEKGRDKCRVVLTTILEQMKEKNCEKEPIAQRFEEISRLLKLSELESKLLLLAYIRAETCFCWPCRVESRDKALYYSMALDRSYSEVLAAMNEKSRLAKFCLLDDEWDWNRRLNGFLDGTDAEPMHHRFYKKVETEQALPWTYFGDLAKRDGTILKKLLAAKPKKCNILLYGAPGTGKSSFALALVREAGRQAFSIKQGQDNGKDMNAESRMIGIQVCNEQEIPDESIMLIDEADELLRGHVSFLDMLFGGNSGGKSTEKGVMNTLLDEMKMPAIWISNTPAGAMDESTRRRMDYSIEFSELNGAQRIAIWRNVVEKQGLGKVITEEKIADYADRYETSAGGIATVLENVKRMKPRADKVDGVVASLMKPHCKLMGVKDQSRFLPAKDYSLEGLNIQGKVSLEKIVKAVGNYYDAAFSDESADQPRMNILLYGAPGSGKTEWVKYLGKCLDRKILVVRGSDLLSKWVGESEQNIARAFRRAEAEHSILFFDEVDGLLQGRENAHASWEVTQVNEILQQMENFKGVMVAATNFRKNLDPAVMRRFTFKLQFDYLDNQGKKIFFERFFKTALTESELKELETIEHLTPGDFRTVRQEQFYLGDEVSNSDRLAALKGESEQKLGVDTAAKIGFAA